MRKSPITLHVCIEGVQYSRHPQGAYGGFLDTAVEVFSMSTLCRGIYKDNWESVARSSLERAREVLTPDGYDFVRVEKQDSLRRVMCQEVSIALCHSRMFSPARPTHRRCNHSSRPGSDALHFFASFAPLREPHATLIFLLYCRLVLLQILKSVENFERVSGEISHTVEDSLYQFGITN